MVVQASEKDYLFKEHLQDAFAAASVFSEKKALSLLPKWLRKSKPALIVRPVSMDGSNVFINFQVIQCQ